MDVFALIGAVIGFAAILLGNSLEGGQLSALLDGPAAIIVLGGTLGAVMLQTPLKKLLRAWRMAGWVLRPPQPDLPSKIETLTGWSKVTRREGLLGLENILDKVNDPFVQKGLELVVDGVEPTNIRRLLEADCQSRVNFDLSSAQVFRSMGGYAPTIGILGAVIGLIQVLGNLADPDELGQGIATAFIATIYGVGFANLLFLPIADRIKQLVVRSATADELMIEGLIAIAEGDHPRTIEVRLSSFLAAP